jgi:hypothetical protein
MTPELAVELVNYRRQYPQDLTSIAWVAEALQDSLDPERSSRRLSHYQAFNIPPTCSRGRAWTRLPPREDVFDVSSGTPKIIYRQDLSHLGWALGRYAREDLKLAALSR